MKDESILVAILIVVIAAFYYFAEKKATLSVQLMDSSGNLSKKGSTDNPITSDDINAIQNLLCNLLTQKAAQS